MYNDKKILILEDMNIIHMRLTSFVLTKLEKFYKPVLRKMFAEVLSKSGIRYINNNAHKYDVLLYKDDFYSGNSFSIDYCDEKGKGENIIIKKDVIKDLLPKNVSLNINYIKINEDTVRSKNLRKYYDALNMLFFYLNPYRLNLFNVYGWRNPSISEYYRKSVSYLKKHDILLYNILMNKPCFSVSKKGIMNIYEYYNEHFYGYIGRRISFLKYLKAFDEYIIKMILNMRSGEWYEEINKK